jgi:GxxExxY protein
MDTNEITGEIVDAAIKVHTELGPGLFESVYEEALAYELKKRGLSVNRQVDIPIRYDNIPMGAGFRADLLIENEIIIEIKSVEKLLSVHKKQVLTYLRLMRLKVGILINFNEELLKRGINRLFNNYA